MSDEEIICEFMAPRGTSLWWVLEGWPNVNRDGVNVPDTMNPTFRPAKLTLDRLHEVEGRLTDEQCRRYEGLLLAFPEQLASIGKVLWRASAAQKIKALATVLREKVAA